MNLALFPHKRAHETPGASALADSLVSMATRADAVSAATAPLRILMAGAAPSGALLAQALGNAAHTLDYVHDGAAVQRRAAGGAYDLIVLDAALTAAGGLDVCRRLREDGIGALILLYCASASVDAVVAALEAGADDLLHAAMAAEETRARLLALLRRKERAYAPERLPGSRHATGLQAARRTWLQSRASAGS